MHYKNRDVTNALLYKYSKQNTINFTLFVEICKRSNIILKNSTINNMKKCII